MNPGWHGKHHWHNQSWHKHGWQYKGHGWHKGGVFWFWPGMLLLGLFLFGALKFLWPLALWLLISYVIWSKIGGKWRRDGGGMGGADEKAKRKNDEFAADEKPKRTMTTADGEELEII